MSSHTSKPVPDLHPFEVDRSCFPPLERERGGKERDREGERERKREVCSKSDWSGKQTMQRHRRDIAANNYE